MLGEGRVPALAVLLPLATSVCTSKCQIRALQVLNYTQILRKLQQRSSKPLFSESPLPLPLPVGADYGLVDVLMD